MVGVIKTPHFAFDPLRFDGDLSSPLMMVWCNGIPFFVHESSSSKVHYTKYKPMVASFNS
jgi:hypothetical protein